MKRSLLIFITLFIIMNSSAFCQEIYPKKVEAGQKIEMTPENTIYLIKENQFNNTLIMNELYKNSEERINLLKIKTASLDSVIKLMRLKEANYDSTLQHTTQELDKSLKENQECRKKNHQQKSFIIKLIGVAAIVAIVILIIAL